MNQTIIIYEVTPDDYYKYGRENASEQKEYYPTVILLTIIFLLFILGDLIYSIFFGVLKDLEVNWILINIFARLCLTFFLLLVSIGIIKLVVSRKKQEISEMRENALCCEHKLILTENELIEITDLFTNRSSWKVIGEIKESENYLFFGSATSFTYLIPKRYFDDNKQVADFVNTFNTYKQKSLEEYIPSYFALLDEDKLKNNKMN